MCVYVCVCMCWGGESVSVCEMVCALQRIVCASGGGVCVTRVCVYVLGECVYVCVWGTVRGVFE